MDMLTRSSESREATAPWLLTRGDAHDASPVEPHSIFRRSKEQLRIRTYLTLCAMDLLCISVGFLLAGAIRLGSHLDQQTVRTLVVVVPIFLAVALNNRAYSIEALKRPTAGAMKATEALAYASAVAIALLFYLKVSTEFSRAIFAVGTALSLAALVTGRLLAVQWIGRSCGWSFANELIIVDGVPYSPQPGQTVVTAEQLAIEPRDDNPLTLDRLNRLLEWCDRLVIACAPDRRPDWSQALKGTAVDVEILMPELTHMGAVALRDMYGERTLVVSSRPLNLRESALKRVLDLMIAVPAIVLLAPLMLLVAAVLKLESRGPVLFKQQRVGKNNRLFNLLKFRSMRVECTDPSGVTSTQLCDHRLTRVGSFIRSTSIDELPQLFNVLSGNMSIVGPRPHALGSTAEDALFWQIDRRYFHRHAMKPGITGLAQVRGFRGATASRDDLTSRLHADLEYLSDWTIWRDVKIVLATFRVMVHRNAF